MARVAKYILFPTFVELTELTCGYFSGVHQIKNHIDLIKGVRSENGAPTGILHIPKLTCS